MSAAALTLVASPSIPRTALSDLLPSSLRHPSAQAAHFLSSEAVPAALELSRLEVSGDADVQAEGMPREFYFSRVAYTGYSRGFYGRGRSWMTDFPKADQIFLSFIDRLLANLDAYEREHPVFLTDPEIRRFPYLYALEVGRMALTPPEIEGLRSFLMAGGFLVIDDFWGSQEWANFEYQMQLVLPGYSIVDLPLEHPLFSTFYEIDEIMQVPNINNGLNGWQTHERDGIVPMVKGIHDENGRLMVVINFNTDLGDAWEWADHPYYPLKYSTYAYEMGVNMVVYAMSH